MRPDHPINYLITQSVQSARKLAELGKRSFTGKTKRMALLFLVVGLATTTVLHAQTALVNTRTWVQLITDTDNDNFGRNNNWSGGNEPNNSTTRGLFNLTGVDNPLINVNRTAGQLWFTSASDAITFALHANNKTLTINASNGDGLVHEGNVTHKFDAKLALGSNQTWYLNGTTGDLEVNDDFNLNSYTLTVNTVNVGNNVLFSSTGGAIVGTGGFVKTGAGTMSITGANTYSGATSVNQGTLSISNATALGATSTGTTVSGSGSLSLEGTGTTFAAEGLTLNSTGSLINTASSNTWTGTMALNAASTIDVTAGSLNASGVISGANTLTKKGTGSLTLSGTSANTNSGLTTVNDGTLILAKTAGVNAVAGNLTIGDGTGATSSAKGQLTNANQIADTSSVTLLADGQLDLSSKSETIGSLNSTFSAANILLGSATLTTGGNNSTDSYAGSISGTGGLTKTGTGTMTLSGANTYTGATTLTGGTLSVGTIGNGGIASGNLGSATNAAANLVFNGGTLQYTGSTASTDRNFTINTGKTATIDVTTNNLTISGASTSTNGALTKTGTGTMTLSGANLYTGTTTVSAGVLDLQNAGALGTSANTSDTTIASGATLQLSNTGTTTNAGTLVLNGTGGGLGALRNASGTNAWNSDITLGSAATINSAAAGQILYLGNTSATSLFTMASNTLTFDGAGDTYVYSNLGVSGDTGGVVKNGTGKLTYYGYNSFYTGATTVNAGSLDLLVGPFSPGFNGVNGDLTIGVGSSNPGDAGTVSVNIAYNSYANQISNSSNVTINSDGILNAGNSTGLGNLTLNGGQVSISNGKVISPTGNIVANTNSAHLTSLISGGELALAGATTFTVARDATLTSDLTTSSTISGAGSITKAGTGILTLSGTNTFTGSTTVNGGTIIAANNSALGANTASAVVNTGGTLALDGGVTVTKSSGALTLASAGATGSTGALHAAGTTGTTSQWSGNITLTGDSTMSAADNLLIVGEGVTFTNTIGLGSNTLTLDTTSATGVTPTYLPYPSYLLDPSNIVINSTISGTGGITKTGVGTATIISPTQNTFTGDTQITGGKLIIDGTGVANNPVISSSNVVIGNSSSPGAADSVILQMGQVASPPSANYLIGTYDIPTNVASTSMTVYADGLFDMNGASNRLSSLTLQGGHVTGGDATVSPLLTLTSGVTTLADAQTALIEAGFIGMSANGFAFNVADGAANTDLQIDSILQNGIGFTGANNTNSMVKSGTGTLVLTSLNADGGTDDGNTYSGVTDIQAGVLNIQHNNALGQTGPSIGHLDNSTTVQTGAQLQLEGGITVGRETLTLRGTGIANTGALLNQANNNTYNGYVYLATDSRINANSGTTLTIANPGGVNAGILNGTVAGKNLTVGGSGDTTINGAIGGFVNTITKDGTGTLTLAGNNAYAGATAITSGAVKVTHDNGLSGTGATVSSGAALQFAQDATNTDISVVGVAATISGTGLANGGAIQNLNGANSYAGNVTLAANARVTADSGSSLTLSGNVNGAGFNLDAGGVGNTTYNGVISGAGSAVTKTDAGTVTFGGSSANTFDGGLNVNDGTLNLNKTAGINAVGTGTLTVGDNSGAALSATLALQGNNQMADPTALVLNSDGRISMGTATDSISTIAGTGQIDLGSGQLTVGADNSSSSFSGSATGTGTLEKLGTGSLTLNTNINYNGTLKVGGGTLVLNNMDLSVTNLVITADTVLDFSGVSSNIFAGTLSFLSTSITLNIINWNKNVDYFYASNWAGATQDLFDNLGATPMSQIVFNAPTWSGNNTGWDSYDDQIYPNVPEPSTYGLFFIAACSALFALRKYRAKRSAKQLS